MRRAVLATTGISSLVVLLLTLKPHQLPATSGAAPRSSTPSSSGTSTGTASGAATGTFTGDPVDTQYGTVQVAVTLAKGKLTAVKVLQAPDQNGRDQQIASYSLPRLTQEAIGAQSAHIDAVSGASYTSQGYIQSLQSALDQARA
ncbi:MULTISPECIES: FMN-binding protein [unclassified Streptomyces]|uniref:FMN-binding protein n=1 Tax=unclassified Streptomyces TaxID=2593676 RepID=UPI0009BC91EB|nr:MULTISPECIES: FMN-binding protein [unclassified Streptomyces]MCX4913129.1 FMN-binding protein [Streptomyces sp. NBC_00687]NEB33755.1 FMN-binding protein [Streptomyces sp. SID14446]OQQ14646.1 FMN-binding protein [Streptomyces sp. M41(2017)]WSK64763.1 FMN-binding protein [Streptomyces sp. NBC_01281]